MEFDDDLFDTFPKEMQEFIVSKQKWVSEVKNKPAELSTDQRIFCNNCRQETNHSCLNHQRTNCFLHPSKIIFVVELDTEGYRLWKCAGCDSYTLEYYGLSEIFNFSEKSDDEEEEIMFQKYLASYPEIISLYYPKRGRYSLNHKSFRQLTEELRNIYEETVKAYNNELPMLCAIGIRALIEGICADQEITGGNLEKKIDGLANILPKNIVVNLHNLRFMGNEAAHELSAPNQEELKLAIEICEDLLNFLYELDYKANSLNKIREKKRLKGKGENLL